MKLITSLLYCVVSCTCFSAPLHLLYSTEWAKKQLGTVLCIVTFHFRGEKFLTLPYVVKGMDVSFSGILSHLEEQVDSAFMEQVVCILKVSVICIIKSRMIQYCSFMLP